LTLTLTKAAVEGPIPGGSRGNGSISLIQQQTGSGVGNLLARPKFFLDLRGENLQAQHLYYLVRGRTVKKAYNLKLINFIFFILCFRIRIVMENTILWTDTYKKVMFKIKYRPKNMRIKSYLVQSTLI
jgi:hypothetical protein